MALTQFYFESRYLKGNTQINVILPDLPQNVTPQEFYRSGIKYPVLFLLHGTFGDASDWVRRTAIEQYACERNLIVVMPSALNTNYSNWDVMLGIHMWDFMTEELMPLIYGWFPASDKREDNFIAGLSMGGRGTLKFAVNYPEKFAAAAMLSAAPVDWELMRPGHPDSFLNTEDPRLASTIKNAGGLEKYKASEENVWRIMDEKQAKGELLPRLFFACGEDDTLVYHNFVTFKAHAEEIGLDAEFLSIPGYKHEWRFWDRTIQDALDFFGVENKNVTHF